MRALLSTILSLALVAGIAVLAQGAASLGLPGWLTDTAVLLGCIAAGLGILAILDSGRPREGHDVGHSSYARGHDGGL